VAGACHTRSTATGSCSATGKWLAVGWRHAGRLIRCHAPYQCARDTTPPPTKPPSCTAGAVLRSWGCTTARVRMAASTTAPQHMRGPRYLLTPNHVPLHPCAPSFRRKRACNYASTAEPAHSRACRQQPQGPQYSADNWICYMDRSYGPGRLVDAFPPVAPGVLSGVLRYPWLRCPLGCQGGWLHASRRVTCAGRQAGAGGYLCRGVDTSVAEDGCSC
jgi:hypothetical protein